MEMSGIPIAAPSANRFSRPSPTTAAHVIEDLDGRVDLILDGGPTDIGLESTIVDFSVDPPVLRRPGGITLEQVQSLVPEVIVQTGQATADEPQTSPGQLTRHYAPRATLTLFEGPAAPVVERIAADARTAVAQGIAGRHPGAGRGPQGAGAADCGVGGGGEDRSPAVWQPGATLIAPARELFAAIRALDATGVDVIFASSVGHDGLARAIRDRLTRAADGRVRTIVQG